MSDQSLWNSAAKPDKAERLDMSDPQAGVSLESSQGVGYVWPSKRFLW
jgi:hypothetical protein